MSGAISAGPQALPTRREPRAAAEASSAGALVGPLVMALPNGRILGEFMPLLFTETKQTRAS